MSTFRALGNAVSRLVRRRARAPERPASFWELTAEQKEALRKEIESSGGHLLWLTHPLFHQIARWQAELQILPPDRSKDLEEGLARQKELEPAYEEMLARVLRSSKARVVIIYEPPELVERTMKYLQRLNTGKKFVWLESPSWSAHALRGWEPIGRRLRELGVERIGITGVYSNACVEGTHSGLAQLRHEDGEPMFKRVVTLKRDLLPKPSPWV